MNNLYHKKMIIEAKYFLMIIVVIVTSIDLFSQDSNIESKDKKMKLFITAYELQLMTENDNYKNDCFFFVTEQVYLQALKIDKDNIKLNYNFWTLYNNKVVYLQGLLDENMDVKEFKDIEKEITYCMEKAKFYYDRVIELQNK